MRPTANPRAVQSAPSVWDAFEMCVGSRMGRIRRRRQILQSTSKKLLYTFDKRSALSGPVNAGCPAIEDKMQLALTRQGPKH